FNKEDPQEVMASWLFMQFLLTNGVQTAYSETEGYVPVTTKAQQSPEYQEYLALEGTDDKEHYAVKIQAAKLLLDNTENTFVTPVFNGSVSLRDSAGQLIETTTKSTRRKETVDEAYMDKLFDDVTALYRLDLSVTEEGGSGGKKILGPLPAGAKALLISLAAIWVLIGAGALFSFLRKKKRAAAG
ncbi:MAG: extracellular solute-binding protein, partial [Lachnospiraceae bacterium]|nr:extracellular solute-binding protein [Lachnospiraceae bacterium]